MHFTTLFILKGEELEDLSLSYIEEMFCDRYCYCCGETTPKYQYWCDWFQIGGRWCDLLKAKKGLHGEVSWMDKDYKPQDGLYSAVNIRDLTEPIDRDSIYAVATLSRIYQEDSGWQVGGNVNKTKFHKLLDDIDNKKFDGVVVLIDCHD